jgi:hypothetical protein
VAAVTASDTTSTRSRAEKHQAASRQQVRGLGTASKQSNELVGLFSRLSGAIAANPNMSMGERRAVMEHLGDATAEPGGVDYIEVDAAGVPAMWAVPKQCAQDRVLLCAHGGGYIPGRCTRICASLGLGADFAGFLKRDGGVDSHGRDAEIHGELDVAGAK